jgi:hypothetical protein
VQIGGSGEIQVSRPLINLRKLARLGELIRDRCCDRVKLIESRFPVFDRFQINSSAQNSFGRATTITARSIHCEAQ